MAGDDDMPSHLKELVRARMEKTGESHQQALRHVRAQALKDAPREVSYIESEERTASVADTAFSIAVVRAEESARPKEERLFEDPYAAMFAAGGAHVVEETRRFVELPFFRDGIRLRTKFIDDAVRDGLAAGLAQVVLLGAGFDARGLRMPEIATRRARVFEVDVADQLARKKRMLAKGGVKLPAHITYVPFDFSSPDLEEALTAALKAKGFKPKTGAMFVWEGVIGYISDATIDRTLRFMAQAGGPRTRVAFTYGAFDTEPPLVRARRAGFSSCEELGLDKVWRRYLAGDPAPTAWVTGVALAIV